MPPSSPHHSPRSDLATPDGLCWVSDTEPGIHRRTQKDGFAYVDSRGKPLRAAKTLQRIKSLAIPPAYEDVWICALPNGHLQATGRDARGRKQYRYHADWQAERSQTKFDSLRRFGEGLPAIRRRLQRELQGGATPTRQRVLVTLVRLLDTTWLRIGNDEYAHSNKSYGLTTLQNRHARVDGSELRLSFSGKSGVRHTLALNDPRVARVVRGCQDLPGHQLFQYLDEAGETHRIASTDVNSWLADSSGEAISAKDFRTWHGSVLALQLLLEQDCEGAGSAKARLNEVIAAVAARLGNTPAVCRKSYIHPKVLELGAALVDAKTLAALRTQRWAQAPARRKGLALAECQLLALLKQRPRRTGTAAT